MIHIGVFDRFHADAAAWLRGQGFELHDLTGSDALSSKPVWEGSQLGTQPVLASGFHPSEIEAALIRSKTAINEAFLSRFPKLKCVVSMTAGFDHLDLDALKAKRLSAEHCPSAHSQAAAELTLGLALANLRHIPRAHVMTMRHQGWGQERHTLMGGEIQGRNWGIVGLGRIGQRVARLAHAFGVENVFAYDPFLEADRFTQASAQRVGLEELFELCEIISLHVPLTRQTRGMIHRGFLDRLKPQTLLINTSRGEVINEVDLFEHFRSAKPGRFALDVLSEEPIGATSATAQNLAIVNGRHQLVTTPHVGALTEEALLRVSFEGAHRIARHFGNENAKIALEGRDGELPPNAAWFHSDYNL